MAFVGKATGFSCFPGVFYDLLINCGRILEYRRLNVATCRMEVTSCSVTGLFFYLTGEEDGEKTTVAASDPGQQSAVPHYDVTLEGLQLTLMDRHNFSGANSSKAYFNLHQIHVFSLICFAIYRKFVKAADV